MDKKNLENMDDETFVKTAYNIILNREPDYEGYKLYLDSLKKGDLSRIEIIAEFTRSPEFLNLYVTRGKLEIWNKVHEVRLELIKNYLPEGKIILDLGGSSPSNPRGALIHFGYQYTPEKICIVDLPKDKRMMNIAIGEGDISENNLEVKYYYRSMSDLSCFDDNTFDFVWSGESIEHITKNEAEKVFDEVFRILKPSGKFALDTPNRRVTTLQNPYGLINPEHKIEYYYEDFISLLKEHNFQIKESYGLIDFSKSLKKGRLMLDEFYNNCSLNNNPNNSYLFYVCCVPQK